MTAPHFRSAKQLASDIRRRKIGCLEALDLFLARVDRFNPQLNAVVASDVEAARRRARQADAALRKGKVWGPLHGVPMTIKESYDVVGMPTTWGLRRAEGQSASAQRAGGGSPARCRAWCSSARPTCRLARRLAELQPVYGTTNNPWDLSRTPGGSSGGSAAALAAGLTGFEAGSDIGSSIRNPAHYCGVYGHKPTYGIVPPRGQALPGRVAQGDISVIGPMGRSADDLALGLSVMAGADEIDGAGWRLELPAPRQQGAARLQGGGHAHRSGLRGGRRGAGARAGRRRLPREAEGQGERHRAARHRHRGGPARLRLPAARGDLGSADARGVRTERGDRARAPAGRRELLRADDAGERRPAPRLARRQRGAAPDALALGRVLPGLRSAALPGRGDGGLPARPRGRAPRADHRGQRPPRAHHRPALLGRLLGRGVPALHGRAPPGSRAPGCRSACRSSDRSTATARASSWRACSSASSRASFPHRATRRIHWRRNAWS